MTEERGCILNERLRLFRGQIAMRSVPRQTLFHFGMPVEIVVQAVGYIFALWDDADVLGRELANLVEEERIVGAAEDNSVDLWVSAEQSVNVLAHEIVSPRALRLTVLDERNPEGARLTCDLDVWI
jgi:hypothetical protein